MYILSKVTALDPTILARVSGVGITIFSSARSFSKTSRLFVRWYRARDIVLAVVSNPALRITRPSSLRHIRVFLLGGRLGSKRVVNIVSQFSHVTSPFFYKVCLDC
jgi:hypothetical protein